MSLPIFKLMINDVESGIDRISLVEMPAVESNFLAFASHKQRLYFANEEQQMITGVLVRADYPIYRNDSQIGEYYIEFGKEAIEEMAEKLLVDGHQNYINVEHMPNSDLEGVHMIEMFIKNSSKGISPVGFEDISDGSLFATFKVRNSQVWESIKNGTFKGFSIEGIFNFEEVEEEKVLDEILEMLDKLIDKKKKD